MKSYNVSNEGAPAKQSPQINSDSGAVTQSRADALLSLKTGPATPNQIPNQSGFMTEAEDLYTSKGLKAVGKQSLKANYGGTLLVLLGPSFVIGLLSSILLMLFSKLGIAFLAVPLDLILIFIEVVLLIGMATFFVNCVRYGSSETSALKNAMNNPARNFGSMLMASIFLCFWSLLLYIPGIIKMYSYRLVPYILADDPEIGALDAITLSRQMMDGNKKEAFFLDLSFIPWMIFGSITCGLGMVFWVTPYMMHTHAAFYERVRAEYAG